MELAQHLRGRLERLAPGHGRLLAAVSGGSDSVALLRGLVDAGFDVAVGHFDHRLRAESGQDAAFVEELCSGLRVPFVGGGADVAAVARQRGWNLEDAARRLRYRFLAEAAKSRGAELIATGHTLDDQAETVMLQLLRGAAYLRGMADRRRRVVRPLLDVRRAELRAYLGEIGQGWREDASNADEGQARAWLRRQVMPALSARYPALPAALGRLARLQRDAEEALRRQAEELREGAAFPQDRLLASPPSVQRAAIRLLLEEGGVAADAARIEAVRDQLGRGSPYRQSLRPGLWLRLAYGRLELARRREPAPERPVREPADLPAGVPEQALAHPDLRLRSRRPGDRMRLRGGSKSLAELLIDRKVPREERDALQVLASGSEVLWAEGIGVSAALEPSAGPSGSAERRLMGRALELAAAAGRAGELPIGAVVACEGEIVAEAHNETEGRRDPTAHAEVLALRRAAAARGDWRLADCTLYVTLEPCPMCFGAILESHLPHLVYGAANRRDGALGGVSDLRRAGWKRRLRVQGGVRDAEAAALLEEFFAARRQGGPPDPG